MTLSSAKSLSVLCCKYSGKSFIYIRKRIGPRTVPWGTPDVTGALLILYLTCRPQVQLSGSGQLESQKSNHMHYRICRNISVYRVGVGGALYQRLLQNP